MAIDKNKTRELIRSIREFSQTILGGLPEPVRETIISSVLGPAFTELEKLVAESRPPRLLLVGRSGHGKSSLLNALSGKRVAETADVKPCTAVSCMYEITFSETYSAWTVIDTKGIFESEKLIPGGTRGNDSELAVQSESTVFAQLSSDIVRFEPDVIVHVVSATEVRNLKQDIGELCKVMEGVRRKRSAGIPVIVVISKIDVLGNPRAWPPETYPEKAGLIRECVDYMMKDVLGARGKPIDLNEPLKGYLLADENIIGVIPVCSLEPEKWNIDLLYNFIGERLPEEARLHYFQALRRKSQLRKISGSIIRRFASIAGLVGLTPIPVADIFILTPLQLLLIAVICGLSCREIDFKTTVEYVTAMGINIGYAVTLRTIAAEVVKLVPVAGSMISGAIAASGTYMLGKSAEAYFFADEKKKPLSFKKEWKLEEKEILAIEHKNTKMK